MSLYCVVDGKDLGQVATTQGWSDFIWWADGQGYFQMAHLSQHGYSTKLGVLAQELCQSIVEDRPKESVVLTALGIINICDAHPKAGLLIITDGDGEGGDAFDDDEDFDDEELMPASKSDSNKMAAENDAKKKSAKKKGTAKKTAAKKSPRKKSAKKKRQ